MPPIPKKKREPGFRKQETFKTPAEQHSEAKRIREAIEPVGAPATGAIKALAWALDQGPKLVRRGEAALSGLDQSAAESGDSLDQAVDEKVKAGGKGAYSVQRAMSASMLPPGATPEALGIPDDMLKQGPSSAALLLDPVNLLPELGPAAKGALKMAAKAEKLGPIAKAAKWGIEYGPKQSIDRVARVGGHSWKEKELLDARSSLGTWKELKPAEHEDIFRNTLDPATDNPARPYTPMSQLPPKQRVAAQEMDDYFTRSGERNLKRGNIPQLEVNPTSKSHVRRPYGSENDALVELLQQLQAPPNIKGAPIPGVAKARTADIPLGSAHPKAVEADVSLGNIVGSQAEQLGKAEQGRLLVQQMQDFRGGNLSDADWEWVQSKLGGGTLGKINRALDTAPGILGSAARGVRSLNRTLNRGLSQNVLQRAPHYHINNLLDNPGQLALHGLNPASIAEGMATMSKAKRGDPEALRLIEEAQQAGVEVHSAPTRADLSMNPKDTVEGLNREFGYPQTLGQKAKRVITGDALDGILPAWLPFSRKFDSAAEGATRLGAYKSALRSLGGNASDPLEARWLKAEEKPGLLDAPTNKRLEPPAPSRKHGSPAGDDLAVLERKPPALEPPKENILDLPFTDTTREPLKGELARVPERSLYQPQQPSWDGWDGATKLGPGPEIPRLGDGILDVPWSEGKKARPKPNYNGAGTVDAWSSPRPRTVGQKAGDMVADAMLDYGASNPVTTAVRTAFPITGFLLKGPKMVAHGVAKSPLRAKALMAGYEQLRGEPQPGNEPQIHWTSEATPMKVPEMAKDVYGDVRKAFGGNKVPADEDLFLKGPHPAAGLNLLNTLGGFAKNLYDATGEDADPEQFQNVLNNAGQSLVGSSTPLVKAAYTGATGKSARRGFPVPEGDVPHARALAMASELIAPMLPSQVQAAVNKGTTKVFGLNTLGGIYEPREDEDRNSTDIFLDRFMSTMGPSIQQIGSEQAGKNQAQADREAGVVSKKRRRQ